VKRRAFLGSCSLLAGIAPLACAQSAASSEVRSYARTRLVDIHGSPIRYAAIEGETNYVFQYPFAATPCFLLRLAAAVKPASFSGYKLQGLQLSLSIPAKSVVMLELK